MVAVTGVTRALLTVDLTVVTGNLTTGLGVGRTGAAVSAVSSYQVMHGLAALLGPYRHDVGGGSCFNCEFCSGHR